MSASLIGKQLKTLYDICAAHRQSTTGEGEISARPSRVRFILLRKTMTMLFDRIVIAVPDLSAAGRQYRCLFDREPYRCESAAGEPVDWWGLPNTVIELVQRKITAPRIAAIVFSAPNAENEEQSVTNSLGLDIRLGSGRHTADFRSAQPEQQCTRLSVDHLVLRTNDADACIELFSGQLGIRLALDKTVPEWGGRMLFFRTGKLTLEVIESDDGDAADNCFWGIAYQCQKLDSAASELVGRGVALSDLRDGRKPGTRVATVKSHCLEIPTLLIQPASRSA
jgi:hypothetical protein